MKTIKKNNKKGLNSKIKILLKTALLQINPILLFSKMTES
jgi:hypothetical protein